MKIALAKADIEIIIIIDNGSLSNLTALKFSLRISTVRKVRCVPSKILTILTSRTLLAISYLTLYLLESLFLTKYETNVDVL